MKNIVYKERMITVWDGEPIREERLNNESWLEMRNRTQPARDEKEKEDLKIREEVSQILKKAVGESK